MSSPPAVLVVDDEHNMRRVMEAFLRRQGYEPVLAGDGREAIDILEGREVHVVITDLRMPRMSGTVLFEWIQEHRRHIPVIIITAHGTIEAAVEAMKRGAHDFITKPFDADQIRLALRKALYRYEAARRDVRVGRDPLARYRIIGSSPPMQRIYEVIERVADTPATVLITGETGTGKELVAEALHRLSSRRDRPFVPIHCAALPETLLESELFGHVRGAFTGAVTDKPGKLEVADGGTIFLDEVGEIPLEVQVKLLRCLQHQTFERVGGLRSIGVDVRIVAATNKDLAEEVERGRFRQDLYYRLNVVPIELPPLRRRKEDIPALVRFFAARSAERLGRPVPEVTDAALAHLMLHSWPGNIRELENAVERAVLMHRGAAIDQHDFQDLQQRDDAERADETPRWPGLQIDPLATGDLTLKEIVREQTRLTERTLIERILVQTEGNVTQAARKLGISRKSLQTKMKEYGLRRDD